MLFEKLPTSFGFTSFSLTFLVCSKILSKIPSCICLSCLFCLVFLILALLKRTGQITYKGSLLLGLCNAFSWVDWEVMCLQWIQSRSIRYWCLITGDVNLDHSIKVVSVRFLYCWLMIFPFVINKYLENILRNCANILFLLRLIPN